MKKIITLLALIICYNMKGQFCYSSPNLVWGSTLFIAPIFPRAADFNNDEKIDILIGGSIDSLKVFLGNGDGTFGAPISNTQNMDSYSDIVCADYNNDGKIDLFTHHGANNTRVLLGAGNGTFLSPITQGINFNIQSYFLYGGAFINADFNEDTNIDVVVKNQDSMAVLYGTGTGSFNPIVKYYIPNNKGYVNGDFNEDNHADIAVLFDDSLKLYLGTGTGVFSIQTITPFVPITYIEPPILVADVNSDTHDDILFITGDLQVALGNGLGNFSVITTTNSVSGISCIGDYNQDGKKDLAGNGFVSIDLPVSFGDGAGSFGPTTLLPLDTRTVTVVSADFNNDGVSDFASGGESSISDGYYDVLRVVLSCNATTSISQLSSPNAKIKIYPNPTNSILQVAGIKPQDEIKIYDVLGNQVLQSKQNTIDVSGLSNGIYFIKVGNQTQKLIKQ